MPDVILDASVDGQYASRPLSGSGWFWTSPSVGYLPGVDGSGDLVVWKTVNGDQATPTISIIQTIETGTEVMCFSAWPEKATNGDSGTLIGILWHELTGSDARYQEFDTSDDSLGTEQVVFAGATMDSGIGRKFNVATLTKAEGGNWIAIGRIDNNGEKYARKRVAGTWSDIANPWAAATDDYDAIVLPGDAADTADVVFLVGVTATNKLNRRNYDASANTWDTAVEMGAYDNSGGNGVFPTLMGANQHSDKLNIVVLIDDFDPATAISNVIVRLIGSASNVLKANLESNQGEIMAPWITINQQNDDWYGGYLKGSAIGSLLQPYKRLSTNKGTSWGAEDSLSSTAEDDNRWINGGFSIGDDGGRIMPAWVNDDLVDLIIDKDFDVNIAAVAAGAAKRRRVGVGAGMAMRM